MRAVKVLFSQTLNRYYQGKDAVWVLESAIARKFETEGEVVAFVKLQGLDSFYSLEIKTIITFE